MGATPIVLRPMNPSQHLLPPVIPVVHKTSRKIPTSNPSPMSRLPRRRPYRLREALVMAELKAPTLPEKRSMSKVTHRARLCAIRTPASFSLCRFRKAAGNRGKHRSENSEARSEERESDDEESYEWDHRLSSSEDFSSLLDTEFSLLNIWRVLQVHWRDRSMT
jgi:hypothetical protein